jgi:phage baseplate assembly protein W
MADPDFGMGNDAVTDIPLKHRYVSRLKNLGNGIARRLSTPRGSLPYSPDTGFDLRDALNDGQTLAKLATYEAAIARECEKDDRVQAASVSVDTSNIISTGSLKVTIVLQTAAGPFKLVLSVTKVTVTILEAA